MHNERNWQTRAVTVLVILLFSAASVISTNQYQYGVSDHAIIVPFLKSSLNHNLYPDDFLLTQKDFYYTYLWKLCAFLADILNISIPALFFTGYCISIFLIFLGTYLIGKALFKKQEVAFLALFFLLFSIRTFAGSVTIDTIFLTRVAALPVLIFSVCYFLKEKYLVSSLLQGIAFMIHPMTAVYFIVMQTTALVFNIKFVGLRKFLLYSLVLLISSSPVLIWKFLHSPASLNLIYAQPEWLELLRLRSAHHLFPSSWSGGYFIGAALMLCVFFISWKYQPGIQHHRIIKIFVITILVMCVAGTIFSEFIPVSIALNLQLLRSFSFIYFLAAIYYANYFIAELRSDKNVVHKFLLALLSIGILYGAYFWKYAFLTFIFFSLLLVFYQLISRKDLQPKHFIFCLLLTVVVSATYLHLARKKVSIYNSQQEHWLHVQQWAKENTNLYSRFIVPPYLAGFRVESERTVYCESKDGTLMNFNPAFGLEWLRRMEKLGYKKGVSLQDGFRSLKEKDFINISEDTLMKNHSVFLVIAKDRDTLSFPEVYENEKFIAYRIR